MILTGLCLMATGAPFRLAEDHGVWWLRDAAGHSFWSFGVCCTDMGVAPEKVTEANPAYSALKLYPDAGTWAKATKDNLLSWGFNSLGGWSDSDIFSKYAPMPYFTVLHLGAYDKAPWTDIFSDQMAKAVEGAARDQITKLRNDSNLVGYFTDNELGWWTDTLFLYYLDMPASSPGRRVLLRLIRNQYGGNFDRLRRDWVTSAGSFEALERKPDLRLRAEGNGIRVVKRWTETLCGHYYKMVHDAIRRYDPARPILGDRYAQYYDLSVVRAARPYVDAISTNMSAEWTDGGTSRFFLDTLHRVTGKPVIITEFYMTARENQSGNHNSSGGFPVVQTQAQRTAAFRENVAELAARPYVIGAHWFQYTDEPPKGRGDGEDYNMGLVDVFGKPYEGLTKAASALDVNKRHREARDMHIRNEAPMAPASAMNGLLGWPRNRALVAPSSGTPFADLYTTWQPGSLYVGLFAMDFIEEKLYPNHRIPEADRPAMELRVGGRIIKVRFGGDHRKAVADDPRVSISEAPGLKHTVILRIPMSLAAGKRVRLDARLTSHSRAETMSWSREVRLVR